MSCVGTRQLDPMNCVLSTLTSITSPDDPDIGRGVVMITRSTSVPSAMVMRTESVPLLFSDTLEPYT